MSVNVFSNSENILFNDLSCFFDPADNVEKFCSFNYPLSDGFRTYYFSNLSSLPCFSDNLILTNGNNYASSDWRNQKSVENINNNFVDLSKKIDVLESKSMNSCTEEYKGINNTDNGNKPIIWRPFSPAPTPEDVNVSENTVSRRSFRTSSKNIFYSIKPSNVKIGPSKTSVFKAVKKNSFACTQCPSRYMSNRQLNSHMRVHTGSKPFHCEHQNCFKSFARNEELTRHKRIHSGFKPHQCITCKKRFGRKDHLSKHLKTHLQTSEKKVYQCSFPGCGHRYTRSDALTRHKSTAHAIKNQK